MVDQEPRISQYAEQVALELVTAIDEIDANACTEILYKGDILPEIFMVVNIARTDRIPGSGSQGEVAYKKVLAAMAGVRAKFADDEMYAVIPRIRTFSAPDNGQDSVDGLKKEYRSIKL